MSKPSTPPNQPSGQSSQVWYQKGLNFECTGCGACCSGPDGYVWVNQKEIKAMADHLNLTLAQFQQQYLRKVGQRWALKDQNEEGDCIFLTDHKCTVYQARPIQCQTFPWWPSVLQSPRSWQQAGRHCEGIDDLSILHPIEHIESEKQRYEESRRKE
jgi:Fe-S-cluster containining protein